MADLIRMENGSSLLNVDTSNKIAEFQRMLKAIEEKEKALREAIKAEMESKGITQVEDQINGITISYIAPTQKETFNSKKFREENPDLYDEYISFSPVKSYIKIKVKEG
jgi:predicted phage-related endonuclease